MNVKHGDDEQTHEIAKINIVQGLVVREGDDLQFPLRYTLPSLPQSSHYVKFSVHTELDIPGAVDKHDFDDFYVLPAEPVGLIQEGIHHLGFAPKEDSGEMEGHFQKFEYKPVGGAFQGRLSELEAIFLLEEEGVRLYVELDHKSGGFGKEIETTPTVFIGYGHLTSVENAKAVLVDFLEQEIHSAGHGAHGHVAHASHGHHESHGHHAHDSELGSAIVGGLVGGLVAAAVDEIVEEIVEDAIEDALGLDDFQDSIDESVANLEAISAEMDASIANLEAAIEDYDDAVEDLEEAVEEYEDEEN
jgi:sporulation-control protein